MPSRRQVLAGTGLGALGLGAAAVHGGLGGFEPYYDGETEPDTPWWPQPGFDRLGSCYNPRPVGPQGDVAERWAVEISGPPARPVVADGAVFVLTEGGGRGERSMAYALADA